MELLTMPVKWFQSALAAVSLLQHGTDVMIKRNSGISNNGGEI